MIFGFLIFSASDAEFPILQRRISDFTTQNFKFCAPEFFLEWKINDL